LEIFYFNGDGMADKVQPNYLIRQTEHDHFRWLKNAGIHRFNGLRILDLGCAGGAFLEQALNQGAKACVGVDIVPGRKNGVEILDGDLNSDQVFSDLVLRYGAQSFDLVCAFDLIEHLNSPAAFLKNCAGLLKSGGSLMLTTPNASSWECRLRPHSWSGGADPQHLTLFTPYTLTFLAERSGYSVTSCTAPIRKLGAFNRLIPAWGGQIALCATPRS
jgi:2-polyprenyl-3-methyl-5-hydroxy-6-metoxy-1,4-benzoquinol methylase